MEPEKPSTNFWKTASSVFEALLNNPRHHNNLDLLDPLPEDTSEYKVLPALPTFHLKSSSLDTSYKTYNPRLMQVIERSKRFESISNERKMLKTPKISIKPIDADLSYEIKENFQISGKKAKILMNLQDKTQQPALSNLNSRLKNFIGKVQEKYAGLIKAMEFKSEILSFEAMAEYLKKSSILVQRPTYTRDKQRAYSKSPIAGSYSRMNRFNDAGLLRISEKMALLRDIFDPFKSGGLSKQQLFGILIMHEYTNYGMAKILPTSRLDFNNIRHLQALHSQVLEIKRIFKHYSDGKLLTKEGFSLLLLSICSQEHATEIMDFLAIGSKVGFGQFLSIIPLLLENYDNLMIKVQN